MAASPPPRVQEIEDKEKYNLQHNSVAEEDQRVLRWVHTLHVVLRQDALPKGAAIGPAELVVHEPPKGVGVHGDVVAPDPARGDVLWRNHEALAKHEHAEEARAEGHANDVVRLGGPDRVHHCLGGNERKEQVGEERAKAVEVGQEDHEQRGEHGDQGHPWQASQKVRQHVGHARDLPVGPLAAEDVALLGEEGEDGHGHEDQEGLHVEK
mmetsp:Transcript_12996/g.37880  ORF Transcript_12996/g.37880 Transcript_12996/m.37880 type:complete len:210 (+) Transcript_12996:512-1141(+)